MNGLRLRFLLLLVLSTVLSGVLLYSETFVLGADEKTPSSNSGAQLSGIPVQNRGVPQTVNQPVENTTMFQGGTGTNTGRAPSGQESNVTPNQGTVSTQEATSGLPKLPEKPTVESLVEQTEYLTSQKGLLDSLKVFLVLTILSLVPAIFMMTTSFVRIITVLSLLRQALGTGQIPPNQVITALSVFLTLLIMMPVWTKVYDEALVPYSQKEITAMEAFEKGELPIRTFLWKQIEKTGNTDAIWLFMKYVPDAEVPKYYEDIPWRVLLPAFMLSELKTAFLIGFQIFLPFVIIDMVVSAVMVSMGMMMLPPMMISLPFKILLFVLMDGWTLVAKMLLDSFVLLGG